MIKSEQFAQKPPEISDFEGKYIKKTQVKNN